jgi:hypothetical protein
MDFEGLYPLQKVYKERAFALKAQEEAARRAAYLDDHILDPVGYQRGQATGIGCTVEGVFIEPLTQYHL